MTLWYFAKSPFLSTLQKKKNHGFVIKGVDDIYYLRVNFITDCWILHAIGMRSLQCSFSERGSWLPLQVQMWCMYTGGPHGPLYYNCLWLTDCVIWMAHLQECVCFCERSYSQNLCFSSVIKYRRLKTIKCSLTLKTLCYSVCVTLGDTNTCTAANSSAWLRRGTESGQSR